MFGKAEEISNSQRKELQRKKARERKRKKETINFKKCETHAHKMNKATYKNLL